jgi:hypothetical protein
VGGNGPFEDCSGGPVDFAPPSCPNAPITLRTCPDGGVDGGP